MAEPQSLFSSERERRLWICTAAVVGAIYSTLALASTLVEVLRDRGLCTALFIACFFLTGVTILTQGLKVRPRGAEIGVALGIGIVYLMVFARTGIPERSHLFEYSIVAVLIYEAIMERVSQGRHVPVPALLAILATSLIGAVDEGIQWLIPNRVFDTVDILFNGLASLMAVTAMVVLRWARRSIASRVEGRRRSPDQ